MLLYGRGAAGLPKIGEKVHLISKYVATLHAALPLNNI
jgi:hypothetical protein